MAEIVPAGAALTLPRLVLTRVAYRILAALAVLFALLQVLDLLDMTGEILDRNLGIGGVAYYAMLRSPSLVVQALPLAVLAGGLFAFSQLARERAVTAMRAIGVSVYSVVVWAMPAGLAVLALQIALQQWVKPAADATLAQWLESSAPPAKPGDVGVARTFRVGPDLVTARATAGGMGRLASVRIYKRDQEGRLTQRISADAAQFDGSAWTLTNVQVVTIGETRPATVLNPTMAWDTTLRPGDVAAAFGDSGDVSPGEARRALGDGAALRTPTFYEMRLHRAWAGPIGVLIMLLLTAPVALANFRDGSGSATMAISVGAGLLFLVLDGLLTALGEGGAIPVLLGAWAGPAIFAAVGTTILLYREG